MKCFPLFLFALALILESPLQAQLHWKRVSSGFGDLPEGITLYRSTDSLHGRPSIAYYADITLRNRQLQFAVQTDTLQPATLSQFYARTGQPVVLMNTGYFSPQTFQILSLLINNRQFLAYNVPALQSTQSDSFYYPTRGALGISAKRKADVAWVFTDSSERWPYAFQHNPLVVKGAAADPAFADLRTWDYWEWWKKVTAIGGGPVLLHRNRVRITNREEQILVNVANDRFPRTAIGYTRKQHLILLVIEGGHPGNAEGATLEEVASILRQLRAVEALNLNGGPNSCLLINGKETIEPSGENGQTLQPAVFIVREKKASNH